jgi:hypothetical protein
MITEQGGDRKRGLVGIYWNVLIVLNEKEKKSRKAREP